jgi:hypothetical protein
MVQRKPVVYQDGGGSRHRVDGRYVLRADAVSASRLAALIYSTFLGGNASEFSLDGGAIAVDSDGNAYVGGTTASPTFPGHEHEHGPTDLRWRRAEDAVRTLAAVPPFVYTDASVTSLPIKKVHIEELRTALNEARVFLGLPALTYTDPVLTAGVTRIKAAPIDEWRAGVK